jgi:hypothetical protein
MFKFSYYVFYEGVWALGEIPACSRIISKSIKRSDFLD